jgi:hypothetical protein
MVLALKLLEDVALVLETNKPLALVLTVLQVLTILVSPQELVQTSLARVAVHLAEQDLTVLIVSMEAEQSLVVMAVRNHFALLL